MNVSDKDSAVSNPRNSDEAKQHAQDVLDNELHGNQPQQELYDVRGRNKEPNRVAGGLKAYVFLNNDLEITDFFLELRLIPG